MSAIRQWIFMLALVCIAPLTLAEDAAMTTQQQCDEYGVYQDGGGNWIDCSDNTAQQVDDGYTDEAYVEEPYVEEPYIEDTYTEEPYVEQSYTEESYEE